MTTLLNDCPVFRNRQNELLYFAKLNAPEYLTVWTSVEVKNGWETTSCKLLPVLDVSENALKEIKVWDLLDNEMQTKVKEYTESDKVSEVTISEENKAFMAEIRGKRRKKFADFPKEIACVACKTMMKVIPSQLAARMDRLNTDIEKYVKVAKCQVCEPTKGRGRKADPNKKPNVVLKCHTDKCDNGQTYPYAVVEKAALKKGLTVDKFVEAYICQKCCPTRGRKKGVKLGKVGKIKSKSKA